MSYRRWVMSSTTYVFYASGVPVCPFDLYVDRASVLWCLDMSPRFKEELRRELPRILGSLHGPPGPQEQQQLAKLGVTCAGPWMPRRGVGYRR